MLLPDLVGELAEQVHAPLVSVELSLSTKLCSILQGLREFLELGLGIFGSRSGSAVISKLDELLALFHGNPVDRRFLILEFLVKTPEDGTGTHGIAAFVVPSGHVVAFVLASFAL